MTDNKNIGELLREAESKMKDSQGCRRGAQDYLKNPREIRSEEDNEHIERMYHEAALDSNEALYLQGQAVIKQYNEVMEQLRNIKHHLNIKP